MMKKVTTWAVVADGIWARMLENSGPRRDCCDRHDCPAVAAAPRTPCVPRERLPAAVGAKAVRELDKALVAARPAAIVDALGDKIVR